MFISYKWNYLPKVIFLYYLWIQEKNGVYFSFTVLYPPAFIVETESRWLYFLLKEQPQKLWIHQMMSKHLEKTDMQKAISIAWNGLLSGLQNLDINFFWPQKACIWVRVEQVLSRNMRFMILLSVDCKLLKAACLQSAFRKNSGSFVFTKGYQTPRCPLGKIYIYIYAGKIKVLSLPQESVTLMLL